MIQNESHGRLFALAGFTLLTMGDAVIKSMAGEWPPLAVACLRYLIGAIALGALLLHREGRPALVMPKPGVQVLRGLAITIAVTSMFASLFIMPLAEATAITFTSPVFTALLAALFLGEALRRETWLASLMALTGVMIILRPNFALLGWTALLPVLNALGMSVLLICNRFIAGKASALAMQFYVAAAATPFLLIATLVGHSLAVPGLDVGWPHWSVIARCAGVACSASVGHWLIYMGTVRAGAATVAPMMYVQLLVATLLGWLWFEGHPDGTTLIGALIIIGAGMYLWWQGRDAAAPASQGK